MHTFMVTYIDMSTYHVTGIPIQNQLAYLCKIFINLPISHLKFKKMEYDNFLG